MKLKNLPGVLKETFKEWSEDNCLRLGASLAYYTLSSLVPLLLIVLAIATFVLNFTGAGQNYQKSLTDEIAKRVNNPALAGQITDTLTAKQSAASKGTIGTITGIIFLLLAASGVFGELDSAFNIIWKAPNEAQGTGVWGFIKTKFMSFTLVLGVAFLLLVAQVITITLNTLAGYLPLGFLWSILNFVLQIGLITVVFALLFKFLPDAKVEWDDVWVGGLLSAILWIVGQYLLTLYFKYGTSYSSYGALGGVLAFLVYVYYSSQILFLGGEFTNVYAKTHGSLKPVPEAQKVDKGISPAAAVMVTTAAAAGEQRHQEEVAALKTGQYAAAATGGIIGLVGGAVIGGVGLIVGLGRLASKVRGR